MFWRIYKLYPASDKMKHIRPECIYSGLLGLEGLLLAAELGHLNLDVDSILVIQLRVEL